MKNNFWKKLPKPFFALAPMADVTDVVFRNLVAKYSRHGEGGGGPDVLWTEFVSADGLAHPTGREKLLVDLRYRENERPVVAQLFSSNPENMRSAAKLCAELGFDGVDINMGCPDRTIEKQGCGSAMIKTPDIAVEIIRAAKAGIRDAGKDIPLSVKTRVGYNKEIIDEWIPVLLGEDIQALTIHARTRKDLSKVPANWDYVRRVVALRDKLAPQTIIIGNGDVMDLGDGKVKSEMSGCDGLMIGRAAFGNPWLFDHNRTVKKRGSWNMNFILQLLPRSFAKKLRGDSLYTVSDVAIPERLRVMVEHAENFEKELGGIKNFAIMKKHIKAYVHGFAGAKELRDRLMNEGNTASKIKEIVEAFLSK